MIHIIDNLYLVKFDERNLAIIKGAEPKDPKKGYGDRILGYYGSVQTAFKKALDLSIKSGAAGVELANIIEAIDSLNARLDELPPEHICTWMVNQKGGEL
jgi:hypothetical protein